MGNSSFAPTVLKIDCEYLNTTKPFKREIEKIPVYFDVIQNKLCICWNEETYEQIMIDSDIAKVLLKRIKFKKSNWLSIKHKSKCLYSRTNGLLFFGYSIKLRLLNFDIL